MKWRSAKYVRVSPNNRTLTLGKVYKIVPIPGNNSGHGVIYYHNMDGSKSDEVLCVWLKNDRGNIKPYSAKYFELSEFGIIETKE